MEEAICKIGFTVCLFQPLQSPAIWIDGHQYRGTVRLFRQRDKTLIAVNALPLEEYLASVVDSEMPADFTAAARQAQAIAARTYALVQMRSAGSSAEFDVYATSRSQRYLGVQYRNAAGRRLAGESAGSRRIVRQTAGMVCTFRGALFTTYYSAVCGGRTTQGSALFSDAAPPLQPVVCDWCRPSEKYRWKREVPKENVSAALSRYFANQGQPFDRLASIKNLAVESVTGFPEFEVSDNRRRYRISATVLRRQLADRGIHSPQFTVRDAATTLVFDGRGHGHGIGMCQWGARGLGLAGKDCLQIIDYYYPGSRTVRLRADPAREFKI